MTRTPAAFFFGCLVAIARASTTHFGNWTFSSVCVSATQKHVSSSITLEHAATVTMVALSNPFSSTLSGSDCSSPGYWGCGSSIGIVLADASDSVVRPSGTGVTFASNGMWTYSGVTASDSTLELPASSSTSVVAATYSMRFATELSGASVDITGGICFSLNFGYECTRQTCTEKGLQCGTFTNGCGETVSCSCPTSKPFCASNGTCYADTCSNTTCSGASRVCGSYTNPCDYTFNCGSCKSSEYCTSAGKCACPPVTCNNKQCGNFTDACTGTFVDCGNCSSGSICSNYTCLSTAKSTKKIRGWIAAAVLGPVAAVAILAVIIVLASRRPRSTSAQPVKDKPQRSSNVELIRRDDPPIAAAQPISSPPPAASSPGTIVWVPAAAAAPDPEGNSPLHRAALRNDTAQIKELLKQGHDINARNPEQATPLQVAISSGSVQAAMQLLALGANVNTQNARGESPLYTACWVGNPDLTEMLLKEGADPNTQNSDGWSPLHAASARGSAECIVKVLTGGGRINVQSKLGTTPVYHACESGHLDIVRYLTAQGANLDLGSPGGWVPVHIACFSKKQDIVDFLIGRNVDLNRPNTLSRGYTAMYFVIMSKEPSVDMVRRLIASGADPNIPTQSGGTGLHLAVFQNDIGIVKALCECGANTNIKNNSKRTPLELAGYFGYREVAEYLSSRMGVPMPRMLYKKKKVQVTEKPRGPPRPGESPVYDRPPVEESDGEDDPQRALEESKRETQMIPEEERKALAQTALQGAPAVVVQDKPNVQLGSVVSPRGMPAGSAAPLMQDGSYRETQMIPEEERKALAETVYQPHASGDNNYF